MAWIKIDESCSDHRKIQDVGPLGLALFVRGLTYCNRNLTDGHIPTRQAMSDAFWSTGGGLGDPEALIASMIQVGLWEETEGGYRVHDYLVYQFSKQTTEERREAKSEAGKKGADGRWSGKSHGKPMAEPMADGMAETCPVSRLRSRIPSSVPVSVPGTEQKAKERAKRATKALPIPTIEEATEYGQASCPSVGVQRWYDYNAARGWRTKSGPIVDWKAAMRTWRDNGYDDRVIPLKGHTKPGFMTPADLNRFADTLDAAEGR